jgi:hypothetical protein
MILRSIQGAYQIIQVISYPHALIQKPTGFALKFYFIFCFIFFVVIILNFSRYLVVARI